MYNVKNKEKLKTFQNYSSSLPRTYFKLLNALHITKNVPRYIKLFKNKFYN